MMDGEEVYRARLAACLADAEAATLPRLKEQHLAAARSWQRLLDQTMERQREMQPPSGLEGKADRGD